MSTTVSTPDQTGVEPHELDRVVVRFAGDSGDGMQLVGDRFTELSAIFGNDLATLPNYPAEIRAPAGTVAGVSSFQVHISDSDIVTPGDSPNVLVAMNPAALRANVADMAPGETREVAVAGDVEFTLPSIGHGVLPLGGASVVSDQAMSIAPVAQTAGLGRPASYTITIDNPSAAPITYTLDVAGVDPSWIVHLDTPIVVPAGGSATSMLVLQSSLGDVGVSHPFVVTATAAGFATSARASRTAAWQLFRWVPRGSWASRC